VDLYQPNPRCLSSRSAAFGSSMLPKSCAQEPRQQQAHNDIPTSHQPCTQGLAKLVYRLTRELGHCPASSMLAAETATPPAQPPSQALA
jgi:hypothetical protein